MNKGAVFSEEKKYRYRLFREWHPIAPKVAFVGLNPSIADYEIDDPTIRKCISFAKDWGFGGFYMVNLFAYCASDPNCLIKQVDPVGSFNDRHLKEVFKVVDKVVCAWGYGGIHQGRNEAVLKLISEPYCIAKNSKGEPAHPLYLKTTLQPILLLNEV